MRRFGDRRDAVRVRNVGGMEKILVCFKPMRCDSDVYMDEEIDVTNLVTYMKARKVTDPELTYFHAFCCALGMIFYNRPLLNRFVVARRYYQRTEVSIGFVAKVAFDEDSKENISLVKFAPTDTLDDVKDLFLAKVRKVRTNTDNSTDSVVRAFGRLPQWLINPIVWVLMQADLHDLLPHAMIDDDLYHSSIIVSNLGSIDCGSIYHNLTNFGTSSFLMTMGRIKQVTVMDESGETATRQLCRFGINCDERVVDGFYFAQSMNLFKYILANPELMERPMGEKIAWPVPVHTT